MGAAVQVPKPQQDKVAAVEGVVFPTEIRASAVARERLTPAFLKRAP
ncbi:hypothetical protein EM6_0853 [Asticcacaulis excentricus]|uniref:Uncharacterized protein n=1 Tax=Asticcacaulis excentricus TaxID=78587 RepID=A0A3G9G5L5_9CAUL|nr:hypothetical protein EM6_0853 [Asticcacaulis excentricus]